MRQTISRLCLLGVVIAVSGCAARHVVVEPLIPDDNSVTQQSLLDFMRSEERPSIVLRVPSPQLRVTESQGPQGEVEWNQGYNLIERELVRAGFTVRDRALLEAVLRSNQDLDYRLIGEKIDVQLILEISGIFPASYNNDLYHPANAPSESYRLSEGAFRLDGWQFEVRAILVDSGEVGGIFTIHIPPGQSAHFLVESNNRAYVTATEQGQADGFGYYLISFDSAVPLFVQELIFELKPWTR